MYGKEFPAPINEKRSLTSLLTRRTVRHAFPACRSLRLPWQRRGLLGSDHRFTFAHPVENLVVEEVETRLGSGTNVGGSGKRNAVW